MDSPCFATFEASNFLTNFGGSSESKEKKNDMFVVEDPVSAYLNWFSKNILPENFVVK